jgi:hypothetical protein
VRPGTSMASSALCAIEHRCPDAGRRERPEVERLALPRFRGQPPEIPRGPRWVLNRGRQHLALE